MYTVLKAHVCPILDSKRLKNFFFELVTENVCVCRLDFFQLRFESMNFNRTSLAMNQNFQT